MNPTAFETVDGRLLSRPFSGQAVRAADQQALVGSNFGCATRAALGLTEGDSSFLLVFYPLFPAQL